MQGSRVSGYQIAPQNYLPGRNIYPFGPSGPTIGTAASSASNYNAGIGRATEPSGVVEERNEVMAAGEKAVSGNVTFSWIALAVLFAVLWFAGQQIGDKEDFGNIKLTFFNVVIITLTVLIGLPVAKWLAIRFPLPGVSGVILAA